MTPEMRRNASRLSMALESFRFSATKRQFETLAKLLNYMPNQLAVDIESLDRLIVEMMVEESREG